MTAFSAIDLEKLPPPNVVETLSFEQILSDLLTDLRERLPALTVDLESDPVFKILEVVAYRELGLRARINDASRAVMLAYATESDLDHLAALLGVERQVIDPGDASAIPPILPTLESDARLRGRTQLSLEGLSTAGPIGSYVFHTLAADPQVKDVDVTSPTPGDVMVTLLSTEGEGIASDDVLRRVSLHLNSDTVRPLTDRVTLQSAEILHYVVDAQLILFAGPDSEVVRQVAEERVRQYVDDRHRLGHDITLSGLYAALHQPGVQRVQLFSPTADMVVASHQAPWADSVAVTFGGRDE